MRILFLLLALLFLAAGIVFGALNPAPVTVDFYWLQAPVSLGFALLAAALLGAVLAGMVLLTSVIWPLRARLRRARRQQAAHSRRARPTCRCRARVDGLAHPRAKRCCCSCCLPVAALSGWLSGRRGGERSTGKRVSTLSTTYFRGSISC